MSLFALPVTDADVKTLYNAITRKVLSDAAATAEAAAINAGNDTVFNFAQSLLDANISFSQVAMGMPSLMFNKTPSLATLDNITNVFLPPQVSLAIASGFQPTVYAAEALGLALSNGADFATLFGALSNPDFALAVSTLTGVNTTAILGFVNNWTTFYTANPSAVPSGSSISLAAKGAALGDAFGNALIAGLPIQDIVENALLTIATGQYQVGVPITSLPQHTPLQGEVNVAGTFTVNVDTLTGNAAGAVFTAPPGVSIIGPSNTLNAGDTATALGAAAGTAVLNVTQVASLLGNPALAAGVTLTGIATANILNTSAGVGGFSGNITGLTTANMLAGTNGNVLLGLASSGLNTALQTIGIAADSNLTAWIAAAALAGATDAATVNVNSPNSSLDLLVTGGGNNGYETSTINSGAGTNVFDYDVNYTSLATVNAAGAGNLDMSQTVSTALNMDTLVTFEGTTATGMLSAFFGTGNAAGVNDVTVNGGSNNDNFTFDAANDAVTVRGNAGDDTFTFLSNNAGPTTFTAADLANGDAGTNRLRLQADTGALLGALVGAQIQNIQTIENFTNGVANGLITVDMTQSGSANTLDLAGDYGNQNVTVNGLINTKFVIFTGDNIDDLTLDHTSVVGTVNFTMAQTAVGGTQQIDDLIVPFGNVVNFVSAGNADVNDINGMNLVDANLSITGTKALNLGTIAEPYDFAGGVVDAATFAGNLGIVIGAGRQTVIGGTGNDFINVRGGSSPGTADLINLAAGGNDTVEFNTFSHGLGAPLNNTVYHSIVGFDVANDAVALLVVGAGWTLDNTGNGAPVAPGAALLTFVYTTNQALNATGAQFNFIKVDTPVNTGGLGAEQGFQVAMGPAGSIATSAATTDVAFAYYDATGQQMVLGTVFGAATSITAADHFDATVLIGMSKAAFDAFGDPNLNFVAT